MLGQFLAPPAEFYSIVGEKQTRSLEAVLTEVPSKLRRKKRADLGIALIDIGAN